MASRPQQGIGSAVSQSLGIPPGTKFYSPFPFGGMNQQASPTAIPDNEFVWNENFLRIGEGKLRTAWDIGAPLIVDAAASAHSIICFYFYTLGTSYYVAVFFDDGSAAQVDTNSGEITSIGPVHTFYTPGGELPAVASWGTQLLLISNRNTPNDYWAWDGVTLFAAGGAQPEGVNLLSSGSNYTAVPTVAAFGGSGTGMTFTTTILGGGVVDIHVDNPGTGYQVGDIVQLAFSGSGTGATATAFISAGQVAALTLVGHGSGYSEATVVITGDGTGAAATATVAGGSVTGLTLVSTGTGYTKATVSIVGGGSDSSAILEATLNAGGVAAVNVTAPGSGYTGVAIVSFSGGGGSGATGTATIGSGVSTVFVTTAGSGYTGASVVISGGGGTGATATATVTGGQVTSLTLTNPGSGYTGVPTVTINGDGTGAVGSGTVENGIITGVVITNPGTGYTAAPTVGFTGNGTGAAGVASVNPGGVGGITVVNPGSGFISAPGITFIGGGGAGATGVVQLEATSIVRVNMAAGGSGYQIPPLITFTGGGATTDATATAVLAQGQVVQIVVSDGGAGYTTQPQVVITPAIKSAASSTAAQVNDPGVGAAAQAVLAPVGIAGVLISSVGRGYTSAPTIEIAPGSNNAAAATVSLMPFGVSGSAMETYQQRVWIANPHAGVNVSLPPGGNFSVSAPESFSDFATSDGGVLFTNSDGFLQTKYTAIRQSNGYLYMFGDGSVSIISGVSTSGNPATTVFNYQNVDPQTGVPFPYALQDFGKTILFANEVGVFGLYGGSATLASAKLTDVWQNAVFTPGQGGVVPSAACATLFDIKHYLVLVTTKDPDTGNLRTVMAAWNEKDWVIVSQSPGNLTFIGTQKIASKLYAWGTDGRVLWPMFRQPSTTLTKRLDTKLYGGGSNNFLIKDLVYLYIQAQDQSGAGIDCTVDLAVSGMTPQPSDPGLVSVPDRILLNPWVFPPSFPADPPYWPVFATKTPGVSFFSAGLRLSTRSPDFILANLSFTYSDISAHMG